MTDVALGAVAAADCWRGCVLASRCFFAVGSDVADFVWAGCAGDGFGRARVLTGERFCSSSVGVGGGEGVPFDAPRPSAARTADGRRTVDTFLIDFATPTALRGVASSTRAAPNRDFRARRSVGERILERRKGMVAAERAPTAQTGQTTENEPSSSNMRKGW